MSKAYKPKSFITVPLIVQRLIGHLVGACGVLFLFLAIILGLKALPGFGQASGFDLVAVAGFIGSLGLIGFLLLLSARKLIHEA